MTAGTGTGTHAGEGTSATGAPELLRVQGLRVASRLRGRERTIVSGLDLDVAEGETIGIVGESGSGKSLTARAVTGLLPTGVEATGSVAYRGRELLGMSQRELGDVRGSEVALVFQDPFTMLNPLLRAGSHISELLRSPSGGRLSRRDRHDEEVRRLAEVGIEDPGVADRLPFELSGGMRQRVGIAAALARDPRLLIADEPSTALDVTTQRQILDLLRSLQESRGMGLVMITHDLRVAFAMCDRVFVLYAGTLVETGPAATIESEPLHPYTLGLLMSEPPLDRRLPRLPSIPGSVPGPDDVAGSCAFAPRCDWVEERCREASPPLVSVGPDRGSACVRLEEVRPMMAEHRRSADVAAATPTPDLGAAPTLLRCTGVGKTFTRGGRTVEALVDVDVEVRQHESVGIVGGSGSGKTTLGRCVVGLERATTGSLDLGGIDVSDPDRLGRADRAAAAATAQIVFQDPYSSLNPVRTVGATLAEAIARRDGGRRTGPRVGELLERVGLPSSYAARKPVALSGGERQRVAIARAVAGRPRLLVCDEPVSALDVSVQAQILNLLGSVREELRMSLLFVSHDLGVVRQVVDRVYVLHLGRIVEAGPVDQVLDDPQHAYTRTLVSAVLRPSGEGAPRTSL